MAEYIEKGAVLSKCEEMWNNADETIQIGVATINAIDRITDFIEAMPSADVQPICCGRWEYSEKEYEECAWYFCSLCDEPAEQLYNDEPLLSEFCPHCGARMDE